jgi:hypothetical protein
MGMDLCWRSGQRQAELRNVKPLIDCGAQAMLHRYRLERIDLEIRNPGVMTFGSIFSLVLRPREVHWAFTVVIQAQGASVSRAALILRHWLSG